MILYLGIFFIIFNLSFNQGGGLLNLYCHTKVDRFIGNFEIPTAWIQSLNPLFIVSFAPIVAYIWASLGEREPSTPI